MQNIKEVNIKKEIIVKRISASKFEVYDGTPPPPPPPPPPQSDNIESSPDKMTAATTTTTTTTTTTDTLKTTEQERANCEAVMTRKTVIQRAPPARRTTPPDVSRREEEVFPVAPMKKRKVENVTRDSSNAQSSVVLIKDAIMYRIVDILMFKVLGENQLKVYGYPMASTYQILWRVVRDNLLRSGSKKPSIEQFSQDHDCGGNTACFTSHVYQFVEVCAPYLWSKMAGTKLPIEEVLRRIYYEDLIPYLRSIDVRNNVNILQCHSDIVLLEKWEKQKFTAVTWSGQKYFSQTSVDCPKCPQCSSRHF